MIEKNDLNKCEIILKLNQLFYLILFAPPEGPIIELNQI